MPIAYRDHLLPAVEDRGVHDDDVPGVVARDLRRRIEGRVRAIHPLRPSHEAPIRVQDGQEDGLPGDDRTPLEHVGVLLPGDRDGLVRAGGRGGVLALHAQVEGVSQRPVVHPPMARSSRLLVSSQTTTNEAGPSATTAGFFARLTTPATGAAGAIGFPSGSKR